MQNKDHSLLRSLCTHDLQVTVDLPSLRHTCYGVQEFLEHKTMSQKPPKITKTYLPLMAVPRRHGQRAGESMEQAHNAAKSEVVFAREVAMGMTDVRQEFTVRKVDINSTGRKGSMPISGSAFTVSGKEKAAPFICCHVSKLRVEDEEDEEDGDGGAEERDAHFRVMGLKESFATLDSDCSGHLSLSEIADAMELVGLQVRPHEIRNQLNGISTDRLGGFELQELDVVLRRDKEMQVGVQRVE